MAEQIIAAVQASEPDTLIYVEHSVEDSPLSRVFYELYASQEAHGQHESAEYFKSALVELEQYVESARVE